MNRLPMDNLLMEDQESTLVQANSHGQVVIFRKEGMITILEWMSTQSHEHLHAVNMAGKHGIRFPGLLIVPSETEKRPTIL
jgi:hypothetical protein